MRLLGKWLGYEKTLVEAHETMKLKDERIERLVTERANLLKANTRIGRLCSQLKELGQEPVS